MKANIGTVDRIIRLVAGLVLIALAVVPGLGLTGGAALHWVLGIVGVVLVATAAMRFCPAYRLLGLSTCGRRG